MTTWMHFCLSVRGALNWDRRTAKRNMKSIYKNDGTPFRTVNELRSALMDELAQGHEVVPLGDCDNFDWKTGCKGHPITNPAPKAK